MSTHVLGFQSFLNSFASVSELATVLDWKQINLYGYSAGQDAISSYSSLNVMPDGNRVCITMNDDSLMLIYTCGITA